MESSKPKDIVYIVEDSKTFQMAFKGMLESLSVETRIFDEPTSALAALANETPSLVISDFEMPNMNGLDFLKEFKSLPERTEIPFLILSMKDDDEAIMDCLRNGADDYIVKRTNPEIFLIKIKNYLMINKARKIEKHQAQIESYYSTLEAISNSFGGIVKKAESFLSQVADDKGELSEKEIEIGQALGQLVDEFNNLRLEKDLEKILDWQKKKSA
jgi:DNA-binding response OmpR family regulator